MNKLEGFDVRLTVESIDEGDLRKRERERERRESTSVRAIGRTKSL